MRSRIDPAGSAVVRALQALVLSFSVWLATVVRAADPQPRDLAAAYERAAIFQSARTLVSRLTLRPNWIAEGNAFWYLDDHWGEKTFILVDPDRNRRSPAFDHARLADGLSLASGRKYTANALPFEFFEYRDNR